MTIDRLFGSELPENWQDLMTLWNEICPVEDDLDPEELETLREAFLRKYVW